MNARNFGHRILAAPSSPLLKRMGLAGFSFFFIKGMLWLLIPLLAHTALFN